MTDDRWTVRKAYAHHRPESKTGFSWGVRVAVQTRNVCRYDRMDRPDSPDNFPRENGEFYSDVVRGVEAPTTICLLTS